MTSSCAPVPNRRAMMASALTLAAYGAAAAGLPAGNAPPPDPHPERLPELLRLWAEHKRTAFGWGYLSDTTENHAAEDAHDALVDACMAVAEMPAPRTMAGLAAVATALGLAFEQFIPEGADDVERALGAMVGAALVVSGAPMPVDWKGLFYRPAAASVALDGEGSR
nr:hypothetical protein [Methylobacterium sp. L1A1]